MVKENNRDDGDVKLFQNIIGIASLLKNEPSTSHRSENWPSPRSTKEVFFWRFKLFFLWSWLLSSCKYFCKVPVALLKFSPCLGVRRHFIRSIVRILKLMPCFAVESRGILAKPCLFFVFQLLHWLSILWMICTILVLLRHLEVVHQNTKLHQLVKSE